MKNYRNIKRLVKGIPAIDGAGVQLVRLVGHNDIKDFDPSCFLTPSTPPIRPATSKVFRGIRTGGWKPSLTLSKAKLNTATASGIPM